MIKLKIAIDFDDVLALCTEYAIQREAANGNYLDYNEVKQWGTTGKPTDAIFKHFAMAEFYETQPLYSGAKEFVKALLDRGHEICILTAVDQRFASIRAKKIMQEFPEINERNIILTNRKDLVHTDVLIDDAPHNLKDTPARFPICMRRPWNEKMTGFMSAFSYEEILSYIDRISKLEKKENLQNVIYCLVGPSGSGKTAIARQLAQDPRYAVPKTTTTRAKRIGENENAYNFISSEEFTKLENNGVFLETTVYAGNYYGTTEQEIEKILQAGKNVVMPIDMCGANALKMKYQNRCIIVYVKRSTEDIVDSLLLRYSTQIEGGGDLETVKDDIKNRIMSIGTEKKNEVLCDRVLVNKGNLNEVIQFFD